jgi:hypothetical protein
MAPQGSVGSRESVLALSAKNLRTPSCPTKAPSIALGDDRHPIAGIATYRDGKMSRWEDFREPRFALEAVGRAK